MNDDIKRGLLFPILIESLLLIDWNEVCGQEYENWCEFSLSDVFEKVKTEKPQRTSPAPLRLHIGAFRQLLLTAPSRKLGIKLLSLRGQKGKQLSKKYSKPR
jgi:hypothetical protein